MKHRMMFSFVFVVFRQVRGLGGAVAIRNVTHDGVFTEDDPVLPEQGTKLAKEQASH